MKYMMSSKIEVAGVAISSGKSVEFVCHYERSLNVGKSISVDEDDEDKDQFNAVGHLKYELSVNENVKSGGNTEINIKPLHKLDFVFAR